MGNTSFKRTDTPNMTTGELLNNGWVFVDSKYENLIRGILKVVRSELDRGFWNKHQKEMVSQFDNTGASDFVTDYLTIRSYNWDGNDLPNFDTDVLKIFWYKHSNRGVEAMIKSDDLCRIADIFTDALNQSIVSINKFFNQKGDM